MKKRSTERKREKRLRGRTLCCWYRRSGKRWGQSWRFFRYRTGPERWHLGPGESEPQRAAEVRRASWSHTSRCRGASRLWFPSLRSSLLPGPPSRSRTPAPPPAPWPAVGFGGPCLCRRGLTFFWFQFSVGFRDRERAKIERRELKGFWSEMEGEADGFRSEKMEGEREDGGWSKISEGDNKIKRKWTMGIFKKIDLNTVGSEAAFFKNTA